jgi:hypothetical protein
LLDLPLIEVLLLVESLPLHLVSILQDVNNFFGSLVLNGWFTSLLFDGGLLLLDGLHFVLEHVLGFGPLLLFFFLGVSFLHFGPANLLPVGFEEGADSVLNAQEMFEQLGIDVLKSGKFAILIPSCSFNLIQLVSPLFNQAPNHFIRD